MKDVIGLGCLSVSLFFQIKNPEIFDFKIEEFDKEGERYSSSEDFQHYLDFVSRIGRKVWQHGGGEEANVTLALAKMAFDVGFVGKVGEDKFGEFLIESFEDVDTSRVKKEGFTGIYLVLLPEKGKNSSLIFPNANDSLRFEEIDLAYLNNARFLHMGSFIGNISFEAQRRVVEEIAPSVKISFKVGKRDAMRGLQKVLPLIMRSYVIFLNNQELMLLTRKDYQSGAKELLGYGATNIVCQIENKGWYVASREEDFFVSTRGKPDSEDKTSAASFFVAGFLASLLLGKSLSECTAIAAEIETRCISSYNKKIFPDKELLDMILVERESLKD